MIDIKFYLYSILITVAIYIKIAIMEIYILG